MKENNQGRFEPKGGYLVKLISDNPSFQDSTLPAFKIKEFSPLIDSSNLRPEIWGDIASEIISEKDNYIGFVILHGTDTMAYTSSALSFMLKGLGKPVIVTGSQIPLCQSGNDAQRNLVTAMMIAGGGYGITEVCLFFGTSLMRGNRVTKVHANHWEAFASPNYPNLATSGVELVVNKSLLRNKDSSLSNNDIGNMNKSPYISALRLFPGFSASVLKNILQPPLQGLVIEAYGTGNAPDNDPNFLKVIKDAIQSGIVIVICTQCLSGTVDLSIYESGSAFAKTGVVSGHDMTTEAALAKLFFLFSICSDPVDVKNLMMQDYAGEISMPGINRTV